MLALKIIGWIGTVVALVFAGVAVLAVFITLAWSAFEPVISDIVETIKRGRP